MAARVPPGEGETLLTGTITIVSDPPGALIAYNGAQLIDESTCAVDEVTGEMNCDPFTTPHTFNSYNAPWTSEDRTPRTVDLTREGRLIEVLMDGRARARFGVFLHEFVCEPNEGIEPPAPPTDPTLPPPSWREYCNYTYTANVTLLEAQEVEGSGAGAGSGQGAGSGSAPAGSGAAPGGN